MNKKTVVNTLFLAEGSKFLSRRFLPIDQFIIFTNTSYKKSPLLEILPVRRNVHKIKLMKEYEKQTKIRRVIFISLLVALTVIVPLGFYIFTVNQTLSFKNLDKESYDRRMNDSFLYAFVMFGFLLLMVSPFIIFINNMFKRYLNFIKTLSSNDSKMLFSLNEKENFIYKYIPSYIIREDSVTFFTMFRQNTTMFNDIISINVKQFFQRGYRALVTIETKNEKFRYLLSGNSFKVRNLLVEAITANSKIINNEDWNY